MTNKIRVLIDMDEVLVDLLDEWLRLYEKWGGEKIDRSQIKDYMVGLHVKDNTLLMKCIDRGYAMRTAQPRPGAVDALKRIYEDPRFEVRLVTYARHESWGKAYEAKLAWLWEHAPWFNRNHVLFVPSDEKQYLMGDWLIEDNMKTTKEWESQNYGSRAIIVAQPWNTGYRGCIRFGLSEAISTILECES